MLKCLRLLGPVRVVLRTWRFIRQGLVESGWILSAARNAPVDGKGNPIPWFPYAAIYFLNERLPHDARVFEYGGGHSTLWLAQRVAEVIAVESDPAWASYLQKRTPKNARVILTDNEHDYIHAIAGVGQFQVIVIDGLRHLRYLCGRVAIDRLAPEGVLIWDNADRMEFKNAWTDYLGPLGFRKLTFRSFGPLGFSE